MAQQSEAKFVNEWLDAFHPTHLTWKHVRFGPISKKPFGKLLAVTLRYIDAVVYDGEKVLLIEAKLRRDLGVITQLINARELFPETSMFTRYHNRPTKLIALLPFDDKDIRRMADREGIHVEIFSPEWLMKELSK